VSRAPAVRPLTGDDRAWARSYLIEHWGGDTMAVEGELFRPHEHDGFIATLDGERAGLVTYRAHDDASVEVTSLTAWPQWRGVGTVLLEAVAEAGRATGGVRLWLVTTNDNLDALRFYQRRGLRLAALRPGAVEEARRLKPTIPQFGDTGIAIRDELVLEMPLIDPSDER
jgi:ribosomal protein S18 acetylase RimI-like enzyme